MGVIAVVYTVTLALAIALMVTGVAVPYWLLHGDTTSSSVGIWSGCPTTVCTTGVPVMDGASDIWMGLQILAGLAVGFAGLSLLLLVIALCCGSSGNYGFTKTSRRTATGAKALTIIAGAFGVTCSGINIWLLLVLEDVSVQSNWAFYLFAVSSVWLTIQGGVGLCFYDSERSIDPYSTYERSAGNSRERRMRRRRPRRKDNYETRTSSWLYDDENERPRRRHPRSVDTYDPYDRSDYERPAHYNRSDFDSYNPPSRYDSYRPSFRYDAPYSRHDYPQHSAAREWPFAMSRAHAYNTRAFDGLYPYY